MIDNLVSLLGHSIESPEIKNLLTEWRVAYPTKITCTANEPGLKAKIEKDCIRLYFTRGGNSQYLKPIPTKWKGGFVGIFTSIEFTKKRKGGMPFGVEFAMTEAELTKIMGEPVKNSMVIETLTWRKKYSDKHEFIIVDIISKDEKPNRSMSLNFNYEPDLYLMEDYDKLRVES